MSCPAYRCLCERLIISESVTFTGGTLIINIPQDSYRNGEKYCIVIAQTIPETATITAPVVITIGADTTQYPLSYCDCTQVTACSINSRTRYSTKVRTNSTGGTFVLLKKLPCSRCITQPSALPIVTATTTEPIEPVVPAAFTPVSVKTAKTNSKVEKEE